MALALVVAATSSAAAQAIIGNGTVTLGVNAEGDLNVPGTVPSPVEGTTTVGLRFVPTGDEALSHGSPCEGWGVGVASGGSLGTTGWADRCFTASQKLAVNRGPVSNLALQSFTAGADTATSVVRIKDANGVDLLEVTHAFHPSASPNLYQIDVTITNVSTQTVADPLAFTSLRYRRVMDWDAEPTAGEEFVSIGGLPAGQVVFTSDDGFEIPDPLRFLSGTPIDLFADLQRLYGIASPVPCGFTVNFWQCGEFTVPVWGYNVVPDHGALFDVGFPGLAPGEHVAFTLFYGAAATLADANVALDQVGAEVFSYAQCRPFDPIDASGDAACNLATGAPNTFVFALAGVRGTRVFSDLTGLVFTDANANGVFDGPGDTPLAGVPVTMAGTDTQGTPVSASTVTGADGSYVFAMLRPGSYTVSVPATAAGEALASANPVTVSVGTGGAGPGFAYVAGSIGGSVYTDVDRDGVLGGSDTPLAGVAVTLAGTDVNGAPVSRTATTSTTGAYAFAGVVAGTYTVAVPGAVGALTLETPSPITVALGPGQAQTGVSFGFLAPVVATGSVAGTVYDDVNRDRALDRSDRPLGGVVVTLSGVDVTGAPVSRTVTSSPAGVYAFTAVAAGTYTVAGPASVGTLVRETNGLAVSLAAGESRTGVDLGYAAACRPAAHDGDADCGLHVKRPTGRR